MTSPENISDLFFWHELFNAVTIVALVTAFGWIIWLMAKREQGHHPQVAGHQGTNTQTTIDKRSTEFVNHGAIHIGTPRKPDDRVD